MRARGLARSHRCVVPDRQCPDLTLSELVRLPLAPAISAQGARALWPHYFSYWWVHLWPFLSRCFFFAFSLLAFLLYK